MPITLVVESGQASTTANCYATLAQTTAYWTLRGRVGWSTYTTEQVKAAMIRAAQYVDISYPWKGYHVAMHQAMEWPRQVEVPQYPYVNTEQISTGVVGPSGWAISTTVVPPAVVHAQHEMAIRFLTNTTIVADADRKTTMEKVGPITVQYDNSAPTEKRYPAVDRILKGLYKSGTGFDLVRC